MGIFDFLSSAKDSVSDLARNASDAVKHNGLVQYASCVYHEKKSDLENSVVDKIEKATVIVEKAGDDPAVLLHSAKYIMMGVVANTIAPGVATTYIAGHYVANGLNDLSKRVKPIPGSIVYCNLLATTEHSGVYIGDNKIVHLNKYGNIEVVSPVEFIKGTPANAIYVSCQHDQPVGCEIVAKRAKDLLGSTRAYNVFFDNCHQFSASCLSGDPDNKLTILTMLKLQSDITLNANQWLHWDRRFWQ